MEAVVSEELPLISKGEPNLLWRQQYARDNNMPVEHARMVQMDRIMKMPEPSYATSSGKVSATWTLWYRVQHNVSRNIAIRVGQSKIDGTYQGNKKLNLGLDRELRKMAKEDADRKGEKRPQFFHRNPYLMLRGEKIELDGRLGDGEKTVEQLGKTKLGRSEIGRIVLLSKEHSEAIKALVAKIN